MRLGGDGGAFRRWTKVGGQIHRPCQDLWMVISIGPVIESWSCTDVAGVLEAVRRSDRQQPVLVSYYGQPAHLDAPLGGDGTWDGD